MKSIPINRSFYIFSILFFAILIGLACFDAVSRFQLGVQVMGLQSIPKWVLLEGLSSLVGSAFLIIYLAHKEYRLAMITGLINLCVSTSYYALFYYSLTTGGLRNLIAPTLIFTLLSGIPYAIGLMFYDARKRFWLKMAGIFIFVQLFFFAASAVSALLTQHIQNFETAQWLFLVGSIMGMLYLLCVILNFVSEYGEITHESAFTSYQHYLSALMGVLVITAVVSSILVGQKLNTERYWLREWINRGPEAAQKLAEPFDARSYISDRGDTLKYRLLKPLDYDSTKKYPLVVCLHGGGGRGTDNVIQVEGSWMAQFLSRRDKREKYPAFLLVPQCPPTMSWGVIPGLPVTDTLVFETMAVLEQEFGIDTTRRYVMGESLGGYGTWHFITTRPDLFAAAVPICGGGRPDLAENIVDIPVWAFHGAKDFSVPVALSRDMVEAIQIAGGNPKYTEFPDEGHIITNPVYETPGLMDWVFEQKRD